MKIGNFFNIKNGFTLAEVLITLVIIGVIAALTITTVVSNVKKQEYVSRLKKAYQTLAAATSAIIAEDGNPNASLGGWCNSGGNMFEKYKNRLQIVKDCGSGQGCFHDGNYRLLSGQFADDGWNLDRSGNMHKFVLTDGTQIAMIYNTFVDNDTCTGTNWGSEDACGHFFVDINGSKGPNQFGRDLFFFDLREGGLYPSSKSCTGGNYTYGCSGKVLRENAMNY